MKRRSSSRQPKLVALEKLETIMWNQKKRDKRNVHHDGIMEIIYLLIITFFGSFRALGLYNICTCCKYYISSSSHVQVMRDHASRGARAPIFLSVSKKKERR
jgi:hypothetical protein